jgi:hypothetical protein
LSVQTAVGVKTLWQYLNAKGRWLIEQGFFIFRTHHVESITGICQISEFVSINRGSDRSTAVID